MSAIPHPFIREPQNVTRLTRTFLQSLSAVDIAEPLRSLDETQPVKAALELLQTHHVTVIGVRRHGAMVGWVVAEDLKGGTLGECAREFRREEVLGETASLDAVLGALGQSEHVFLGWLDEVAGVITRRDLQKPPLRMWLFGAITVFDTNLTWAVSELFPKDTWQSLISPGRLEKALALRTERERRGSECALLDCLQIKDKADILVSDAGHLAALGLASRREANRFTRDIEKLRNHLAHAQELEHEHLDAAARLAALIHSILKAEGVQRILAIHRQS